MKQTAGQIIFFLIASTLLGVARNAAAPGGIPWVGDWAEKDAVITQMEADPVALPPSAQEGDPPLLTLAQAAEKFDDRNVVFLDAREPEEFEAGHVTGALLLPFEHLDDYWSSVQEKLPLDREIVTYCSGAECELSLFLARHLRELGYSKISIFFGGWRQWQEAGRPVTIGSASE